MKILKVLLLVLLVAAVGGYFFLGGLLGRGAVAAVGKYGPPLTGTTVSLGSAHLSPFTGGGWMKELAVGNPAGFRTPRALAVGHVALKVKPLSLLSGTIDVEEIVVENPEFTYETTLLSSNLGAILANIERATGGPQPTPAADEPAKKIIIRHFVLEGAKVTVTVGKTSLELPLAKLELHDVGAAKGGVTPAEAAKEIAPQVLAMVTKTAVAALSDRAFLDRAADFGKELGTAAEDLLNQIRGK